MRSGSALNMNPGQAQRAIQGAWELAGLQVIGDQESRPLPFQGERQSNVWLECVTGERASGDRS